VKERKKEKKMLRKSRFSFCLKINAKLDLKKKKITSVKLSKNIRQATSVLKKKCLLSNKENYFDTVRCQKTKTLQEGKLNIQSH